MDATALPFTNASVDAVDCQFAVMFFPARTDPIVRSIGSLPPGCGYLFHVWDSHRHYPFGGIANEAIGRFFPSDPPQFQSVPLSYRFEAAKDSLIDAAFVDINAVVLQLEKDVPDPAILAHGPVCGNPTIDQVRKREASNPRRSPLRWSRSIARIWYRSGRMPLQAIVISTTKPASR